MGTLHAGIDTPAPAAGRGRQWLGVLLKALFGAAVFTATVGGWAAVQRHKEMQSPLPGTDGRQGACVLWFVGSSSMHRWTTLAADMQPWIVHNRGVNGALMPQLRQRFANEAGVTPPQAIVFYAGDNDIAAGDSIGDVDGEFQRFLAVKAAKMPAVPMLMLSVKPAPTRWALRPVQVAFDAAMRRAAARTPELTFVDASAGLFVGGRPGPYFVEDGIHLNPAGYRVWTKAVYPALAHALPPQVVAQCIGKPRDAGR